MSSQGARRGNDARANSRKHIDIPGVMTDTDAIAVSSFFQQDSIHDAARCGSGRTDFLHCRDDGTGNILNLRRFDADNGNAARIAAAQVMWRDKAAAFSDVSGHRRAV